MPSLKGVPTSPVAPVRSAIMPTLIGPDSVSSPPGPPHAVSISAAALAAAANWTVLRILMCFSFGVGPSGVRLRGGESSEVLVAFGSAHQYRTLVNIGMARI